MTKKNEVQLDLVAAKMLKQETEERLAKAREGVKWSKKAILPILGTAFAMGIAEFFGGIIGGFFTLVAGALSILHLVSVITAIRKGGGIGCALKMLFRAGKRTVEMVPFYFIDLFFGYLVFTFGLLLLFAFPIFFYLLMERSAKKDIKLCDSFINCCKVEMATMAE